MLCINEAGSSSMKRSTELGNGKSGVFLLVLSS